MIKICQGNILEAQVEALVNPVNCVGVMGKGLALTFKQVYPENFYLYQKACKKGRVQLGEMFITNSSNHLFNPFYIINFPTKHHWKDCSKIEDIKSGLARLVIDIKLQQIKSIAIPALGCGLGGLNWKEVELLIVSVFNNLPEVQVMLFAPKD